MRKMAVCIILTYAFASAGCSKAPNIISENQKHKIYNISMKQDILCLMMAYPGQITGIEETGDNRVYIVMKSGRHILYDDRKDKDADEELNNADLQDMMKQVYPLHNIKVLMSEGYDPGRIRMYPFLKEVYGRSENQVKSSLVNVKVGDRYYQFNKKNGASEALSKAMKELTLLIRHREDLYPFVFPISGTFNYRMIADTGLLSPHSFGIAIDLAADKGDYWMWASKTQGQKRLNIYPREIVEVFEKNNFIWGGKWSRFDILHYEYRPEVILKARHFPNSSDPKKEWYESPSLDYFHAKEYIEFIDRALTK